MLFDLSIGGTAKKARFESSPNVREEREPEPEQLDGKNAIGSDDAIQEYIDNALTASMAKEERMQEMAEDARRKDNQLAVMLTRMDAKYKQVTELIAQVTPMKTGGRHNYDV